MPIKVTCECGKGYRLSDDKAGKRFKCRDCGSLVQVPDADDETADDDQDVSDDDPEVESEADYVPSHRRPESAGRSAKKKTRNNAANSAFAKRRLLKMGSVIAVLALVAGGLVSANQRLPPKTMQALVGVMGAVSYFILYDRLCRSRIRSDVASYDGTVQRISWRPLQGVFFTRGWTKGKHAKFYEVTYTQRDGRTQRSLVCCTWLGTNWDV